MELDEDNIDWIHPELKSNIQRDIIAVFREWSENPITFEKIKENLIERGQLKEGDGQERWLREKLKQLRDLNILIDIKLPHKRKAGRPPLAYRYNEEAVYKLFSLTEALVDAMGFAKLVTIDSKTYVTKIVFRRDNSSKLESLYSTSGGSGGFSISRKLAEKADFEKTWRLSQHIQELQSFCSVDTQAYKDYAACKDGQSDEVEEK